MGKVLRGQQGARRRAGLPILYQCAGCSHFESEPSFLPELRGYADDLRRKPETMLAAGAADWAVDGVTHQLEVIAGHIRTHGQLLQRLPADQCAVIDDASVTVRKARQSLPVVVGRRHEDTRP